VGYPLVKTYILVSGATATWLLAVMPPIALIMFRCTKAVTSIARICPAFIVEKVLIQCLDPGEKANKNNTSTTGINII
jgi:hypothetical protein